MKVKDKNFMYSKKFINQGMQNMSADFRQYK